MGHAGSLLVGVFYDDLSVRAVDALAARHLELGARYGGITVVSLVMGLSKPPSLGLRERLLREVPALIQHQRSHVVAVLTKGLGGIIARTFLAAISLTSPATMTVVGSLRSAVLELEALMQPDELAAHSAELEAELLAFATRAHAIADVG